MRVIYNLIAVVFNYEKIVFERNHDCEISAIVIYQS